MGALFDFETGKELEPDRLELVVQDITPFQNPCDKAWAHLHSEVFGGQYRVEVSFAGKLREAWRNQTLYVSLSRDGKDIFFSYGDGTHYQKSTPPLLRKAYDTTQKTDQALS